MIEYIGTIISGLTGLFALVGLYIVVKLDINTIKSQVATNTADIAEIQSEKKAEMKELKEMMQQILLKLTKLETLQEYEQGKKDGKNK